MKHEPTPDFQRLVESLAEDIPALELGQLSRYLECVFEWNDRAGLVAKRSTVASLDRLVRQSAQLLDLLLEHGLLGLRPQVAEIIDIGTGAGFPGVVWKLMEPGVRVTLVERRHKKVTFLRRTQRILGLADVEVLEGDASELAGQERNRGRFDVAVSFAVGAPADVARLVEPFLKPGGAYATMLPLGDESLPKVIGSSLELAAVVEAEYGRFCAYRSSADQHVD